MWIYFVFHFVLNDSCRDVGWWRCHAQSMIAMLQEVNSSRTQLGGQQHYIYISGMFLLSLLQIVSYLAAERHAINNSRCFVQGFITTEPQVNPNQHQGL